MKDKMNTKLVRVHDEAEESCSSFIIVDSKNKIIRFSDAPDVLFDHDKLRILQVLRVASVLNFSVDENISESIFRNKDCLSDVPVDRLKDELEKLLCGEGVAQVLRDYAEVIAVIIPEIKEMFGCPQDGTYHKLDVWEHTIKTVESIPSNPLLRITMLLHDIAKPETMYIDDKKGRIHFPNHPRRGSIKAVKILERLKYEPEYINTVQNLIFSHDGKLIPEPGNIKRWLNLMGPETLEKLLLVKAADASGKKDEHLKEKLSHLSEAKKYIQNILENGDCYKLEDLAVSREDLLAMGVPKGLYIGMLRDKLFELVINGKIKNDREQLLVLAGVIIYRNTQTERKAIPLSDIFDIIADDDKRLSLRFLYAEAKSIIESS